jgi:hypothetical protein
VKSPSDNNVIKATCSEWLFKDVEGWETKYRPANKSMLDSMLVNGPGEDHTSLQDTHPYLLSNMGVRWWDQEDLTESEEENREMADQEAKKTPSAGVGGLGGVFWRLVGQGECGGNKGLCDTAGPQ